MNPVIALVGRPNVGKSTLFNRLTKTRDALVADLPGLTRDRKYGSGKVGERPFIVIDTGGISGMEEGIDERMAEQSFQAIDEADIVLFLVDAQAGLMGADMMIANRLRAKQKKTYLVMNKIDGLDADIASIDFHELGLGAIYQIAAAHNRGVTMLVDEIVEELPPEFDYDPEAEAAKYKGIKISIVGRPNVGKSTLVNRMLGEDRVVVYDQAGTTRDSIYIPFERNDREYTLIDTAGVRRRKNITEVAEKFSIIKTLQAIQDSNVAIVVLDAQDGIVEQDLHMLSFVLNSGRALVLAINKWDGMSKEGKDEVHREFDRRLLFLDFADTHFISAKHGTNVGHLYDSVHTAYDTATAKFQTNALTRILEDALLDHQPPLVRGRRIKLRYAHQGGSNPPVIVVHGNQTESIPDSYKKYLINTFRRVLKLRGTPIRFEFKTSENPFAEQKKGPRINDTNRAKMDKTKAIRDAKHAKNKSRSKSSR
jgi:GTP-binding protein